MKRGPSASMTLRAMLACSLLFGVVGCDHEAAGQLATLSGTYVGDLVTVLVTGYLQDAWGVEGAASLGDDVHDDGHTHETGPLHDHEH